jgi:uncharacterized membrane protein
MNGHGDRRASKPLARNIDALMKRRQEANEDEGFTERLAAGMAAFSGSIWSVWIHAVVFGSWILINTGLLEIVPAWDPTLVVLAMIASVEAIFLTTFVLMNQRRQARIEDDRAELTLQTSLLAEHELTRLAALVIAIAEHNGVPISPDLRLEEVTAEVPPETILEEIDRKRPDTD